MAGDNGELTEKLVEVWVYWAVGTGPWARGYSAKVTIQISRCDT